MLTAGGDNFGDRRAGRPANAAVPAPPRPLRPDFAGRSGVTGREAAAGELAVRLRNPTFPAEIPVCSPNRGYFSGGAMLAERP
ncbi:MAG TPA: hypothetical protein VGJ38_06800, partial [Jatrophihabitantaceae bacterium]